MSAVYSQGAKRPKVREVSKASESTEYFQGIDRMEYYPDAAPTDTTRYRHYNSAETLHGRTVEEWLKLAVSLSAFRSDGSDWAGKPTFTRTWDDRSNTLDNRKRCIKACLEFCTKLGLRYWTAFDGDLVSCCDSWEEQCANYEEIAEYIQENGQRTRVKPLWIAPDLHSHAKYASGAGTNYDANIFNQAAAQVKRTLELAQRIDTECFLIYPYREGYDAPFQSDVQREMKLFAKLLKMTAEYKERISYRGQLLIMPYYDSIEERKSHGGPFVHEGHDLYRYMWDATSCMYFLKQYNLERFYKVCVPPGHQMLLASTYNILGGVEINNSVNHVDHRNFTEMMKIIIDQGGAPVGGVTLSVSARTGSVDARDLLCAYAARVDALARGLRSASRLVASQLFSKHVQQRYASYNSGCGARLASGDVTLDECEENTKKSQRSGAEGVASSRREHWDSVLERFTEQDAAGADTRA